MLYKHIENRMNITHRNKIKFTFHMHTHASTRDVWGGVYACAVDIRTFTNISKRISVYLSFEQHWTSTQHKMLISNFHFVSLSRSLPQTIYDYVFSPRLFQCIKMNIEQFPFVVSENTHISTETAHAYK